MAKLLAFAVYASIVLGALLGAWIGWRYGSRTQAPTWSNPYREDHVSRAEHSARLRQRWKRRRLTFTAVLSFAGAFGVYFLLNVVLVIGGR